MRLARVLPSASSGHYAVGAEERNDSLARISRVQLMPDDEDQNEIFGRKPTVLRDIPITATREDELPPSLFSRSSE